MAKKVSELEVEELEALFSKGDNGPRADARIRTLLKRLKEAETARQADAEKWSAEKAAFEAAGKKAIEDAVKARDEHHSTHLALSDAGLKDARGRSLYLEAWNALDPKTRPATPAEFFTSRKKATLEARKDPTKAASAPKLEPWELGYMEIPEQQKVEIKPTNEGAGDGEWTNDRILSTLGMKKA